MVKAVSILGMLAQFRVFLDVNIELNFTLQDEIMKDIIKDICFLDDNPIYSLSRLEHLLNMNAGQNIELKWRYKEGVYSSKYKVVKKGKRSFELEGELDFLNYGTLTYYEREKNILGSLGHSLVFPNGIARLPKNKIKAPINVYRAGLIKFVPTTRENTGYIEKCKTLGNAIAEVKTTSINNCFLNPKDNFSNFKEMEIIPFKKIEKGNAYIYSNILGKIEMYSVKIIDIGRNNRGDFFTFHICDERLNEKFGGVIAGMSGTPIIQNGGIIGYVNSSIDYLTAKAVGIEQMMVFQKTKKK